MAQPHASSIESLVDSQGRVPIVPHEVAPTDPSKLNASYVLSYNASDYCVKIEMTVGTTTYTTNIVPQSGGTVVASTKTISAWT